MKPLELNKEEFFESEFGHKLQECIRQLDWAFEEMGDPLKPFEDREDRKDYRMAQWKIFRLALREFYGIDYKFMSTSHCYGVCTLDGKEWLFKVDRISIMARSPQFCGEKGEVIFCRSIWQQIVTSRNTYLNPEKMNWELEYLKKRCVERAVSPINIELLFEGGGKE